MSKILNIKISNRFKMVLLLGELLFWLGKVLPLGAILRPQPNRLF